MTHEAMVIALRTVERAIKTEILKLDFNAPPQPGTAAYSELSAKIDRWENQVAGLDKTLQNRAHGVEARLRPHMRGPAGFSARQSHASQMKNIADLRQACLAVVALLAELAAIMNGLGNDRRVALEGLKTALKNLAKSADGSLSLGEGQNAEVVVRALQSGPSGPHGFNPGTAIDVFTLVLAFFTLTKALRTRPGRSPWPG